jgi:hypothetical protein
MKNCVKLMSHEIFVLRKDPRVAFKLFISFLLVVYVLSFSLFDENSNILPFFFFGFFFASPLIDYSFYTERIHKRFSLLLGKGFSLREIFISKTLVIFFTGLTAAAFFTLAAIRLDQSGIIYAGFSAEHLVYMPAIAAFNLWMIITSGLIQVRYEIIFPVRLLNILAFLLFVNFQTEAADSVLKNLHSHYFIGFSAASLLSIFLAGRLNKDKIS